MDLQLAGKRVVITGGSKGIGRAAAETLAAEGCELLLVARDPAALNETAAGMPGALSWLSPHLRLIFPAMRRHALSAETSWGLRYIGEQCGRDTAGDADCRG